MNEPQFESLLEGVLNEFENAKEAGSWYADQQSHLFEGLFKLVEYTRALEARVRDLESR